MRKLLLTLVAMPLLLGCGNSVSSIDTNWVYLKDKEAIEIHYNTKYFVLTKNEYYNEIAYRCKTQELNIKYVINYPSEQPKTQYINIYGEYTLIHQ